MQKLMLIAFLTAFSHSLLAQSKPDKIDNLGDRRTELYYFSATNYDSVRFTIQGKKDTVLTERFFLNGYLEERIWQDSSQEFTNCGILSYKTFLNKSDSSYNVVHLNEKGQPKTWIISKENELDIDVTYDENGRVEKRVSQCQLTKNLKYNIISDSLGTLYSGSVDSLNFETRDTLYHRNGMPYHIAQSRADNEFDSRRFYDKNGRLIEEYTPFSKILTPFKDNVDCYYGFKNKQGDTIFTPRFDRYKEIGVDFYAVFEGKKCRLMRLDGTFLTTPDMEDVAEMSADENLQILNDSDFEWQSYIKNLSLKTNLDNGAYSTYNINCHVPTLYYAYLSNKNYGIFDRKGKVVMTPQYREPEEYSEDGQTFGFIKRDSMRQIIEKGYLNRDGRSLFPSYNSARFLNSNYAEVSKFITNYGRDVPIYLTNKNGELILNQSFNNIEQIQAAISALGFLDCSVAAESW
jgi:hypothetical protein